MRPTPAILILAAGASSRMRGADKLLEEVAGTPLILRATRAACAVSPEVIVALPPASPRAAWINDTRARRVEVPDRAMSASIRAGVAACRADALMIHLCDMPGIDAAAFETLAKAWRAGTAPAMRAVTPDGRAGQPVTFDRSLFADLAALSGDGGAKPVLAKTPTETCILPGDAATLDLDTPEDWAAFRARD